MSGHVAVHGHGEAGTKSSGPALKEEDMPRAGFRKTPLWEWGLLFIIVAVIIVLIVLWATGVF